MLPELETTAVYPAFLEIRQGGRRGRIYGRFPYDAVATIGDRGSVRKETIAPGAFDFAINDDESEINLLVGHQFGFPLASKRAGSLEITSDRSAVEFEATLPPENRQPTWIRDAVLAIDAGLMTGLSPGFRVPPATAVSNAQELVPETGNPDVLIRRVNQAVLYEMSMLTRGAYQDAGVEMRDWQTADSGLTVPDDAVWLLTL